jgi:hypothetical protein
MSHGNLDEKKLEVLVVVDEEGQLRVAPGNGMTYIEALAMLELARELVRKKIMESAKVVMPPPGLINIGGRGN